MYEKYIQKRLKCSKTQATQMATVYAAHDFAALKKALDYLTQPKRPKQYRAVALNHPKVPPHFASCPQCGTELQYWDAGRGDVWLCPQCNKTIPLEALP